VAKYDEKKFDELLKNERIIRNKQKINATIHNAKRVMQLVNDEGSFSDYLWQFTGGETIHSGIKILDEMPVSSPESDAMSQGLKEKGLKFVGTTICYAFMQTVGMVNDHIVDCNRYKELGGK